MKTLAGSFLIGLSILLPVILSIQLVIWLILKVESWLMQVWLLVLPEAWYIPGFAVASFLLLALAIGISSRLTLARRFWRLPGELLERTPLVNYIYSTIKDFFDLLGGKGFTDQSVVWVTLPALNSRMLGIVMKSGEDTESRLSRIISSEEVAVYLPMSYQAGGYMLILPRSQVEQVDIEPGEALRLIMSAGLGQKTSASQAPDTL